VYVVMVLVVVVVVSGVSILMSGIVNVVWSSMVPVVVVSVGHSVVVVVVGISMQVTVSQHCPSGVCREAL